MRAIAFVVVLVLTGLLGVLFHTYPQDTSDQADLKYPPLSIGVYVDNPDISVAVRIEVYREPDDRVKAQVFLKQNRPGGVLLTADRQDFREEALLTERVTTSVGQLWAGFLVNDGTVAEPDNDPRGGVVAEFDLPDSSFPPISANGVHARLPAIAFYETGVQYKAPIVRADDGFHDDAVVKGVPSTVLLPTTRTPTRSPHIQTFTSFIGSRKSSRAPSR
jgi:hypothetical protein